jgi:hypothetical protein
MLYTLSAHRPHIIRSSYRDMAESGVISGITRARNDPKLVGMVMLHSAPYISTYVVVAKGEILEGL